MILGRNTTRDISKLSRILLLKYHSQYLCQTSLQINHAITYTYNNVEWRSCYVMLAWWQNFWIPTNHGPANIAEKKRNNTFLCMIALHSGTGTSILRKCLPFLYLPSYAFLRLAFLCYHHRISELKHNIILKARGNMFLDKKTLLEICLNPGLNLTIL